MKKNWPIIILISIAIALCFQNYTPGTILSGWDTLHPEFNFGLTIKREIFGVFRSYQGLGAVAAHSDMADLPRIIFLYLLSPFIPMSFLRYFYIFLTLILGPVGMYFFLKYIFVISNPTSSDEKSHGDLSQASPDRDDKEKIPAFLGALFYLLNLGTMQQFIVPFEMFTTQYAFLPWLFLFATEYLFRKTDDRRRMTDSRIIQIKQKRSNFLSSVVSVCRQAGLPSVLSHLSSVVCHSIWNFCLSVQKRVRDDHKSLLLFALTTLLAAPMAYAATLWYVYFISLIVYLGVLILLCHPGVPRSQRRSGTIGSHWDSIPYRPSGSRVQNDTSFKSSLFKKASILILITLLLNSFWILPNIYFIFTHGSEVPKANINKLFSEQAFLYNKEFGNIQDISFLKTFLFDWNVYSGNNSFEQLLNPWIKHLKYPFVEPLGFLFAGISLSGIVYGVLKRNKILISLLPLLFLCLFFLFNDNSPTSSLYSFLQAKIPFLKEAYRFPQNKVLGIFTFLFAIYFAAGQFLLARILRPIAYSSSDQAKPESREVNNLTMKQLNNGATNNSSRLTRTINKIQLAQATIFIFLLIYFMLPAFKGHFISPYMRIKIPEYYFEMFKWFDKEPQDGRIANLPIHSLWGWEYHDWYGNGEASFQGAGFIWFGIKQPILARDFDRWSPYNEQYYREMSYAIYSQNPEALKLVIEKYNIKYILLDKNIISPPNPSKVLLYEETQELLEKQDYIEKIKEFGNNLIVYKAKSKIPNSYTLIRPNEEHYPFRNLTDNQNKVLPNILKLTQEGVVIKLPKHVGNFSLSSYLDNEELVPSDLVVKKNQNRITITFYPRLPIVNTKESLDPITLKAPIPENQNIILSINKKDNFILETLPSNTPLSLGIVFLKTKEDNTITLYPSTPHEEVVPNLSTTEYYIEPCKNTREQKIFGAELMQKNSFYIFGKNTPLCMTIPLSEVVNKDLQYTEVLLNVAFDYKSNLPLKFCISKLINGSCQNYRSNSLSEYFGIQKEDVERLGLQFQLDTTQRDAPDGASQSNKIEKATYENLSINLTYPFFSASFSNSSIPSFPSNPSTPSNASSLILPFSGNQQLSADITKLPKTHGYCPNSPISNPSLIKKQILTNNNDRFIRYQSIDGMSCDHFSYQNLSQNEAYLIAITSRNIKGLPSTLCITNAVSKHCDIYTTLSSYKDFNTDIFLLPPHIKNENGFDINIGNLGIKKSPSINDLKSIEIIPFPYKWLSQIKESKNIYSSSDPDVSGESRSNNETMDQSNNVLVLPQSFEKGWKAYQVQSSKFKVQSWLNNSFPFIFGKELKDHVLVNSWENGWLLDSSAMKQFNNSTIVFLFLPQYLEYLGFILLLGTFAWLMKKI